MKKLICILLTLAMTLALAACGGSEAPATEAAPAVTEAAAGTEAPAASAAIPGLEDGVFTVGMECAYAPYNWTQMDDANGAVPISNVPGAYANG